MPIIDRFKGPEGRKRLIKSLCSQQIIKDNIKIASQFCQSVILHEYSAGSILIKQEDVDNELHFIISGRVAIRVNHRDIAQYQSNTHVGEMALIDTGATRSASVIAVENTLTAKISEHEFTKIANKYPSIWRYLAIELGARLRQRNQFVRKPNSKPRMFFGSSNWFYFVCV